MPHTPGPWKYTIEKNNYTGNGYYIASYYDEPKDHIVGILIADLNFTTRNMLDKPKDPDADGKLLAAAPELKEHLSSLAEAADKIFDIKINDLINGTDKEIKEIKKTFKYLETEMVRANELLEKLK